MKTIKSHTEENVEAIKSLSNQERISLAIQGKFLDILVYDKYDLVKKAVAQYAGIHGIDKYLDILVKDKEPNVRGSVALYAHRDKDLDILVHDNSYSVREDVAAVGRDKDLDILINDENIFVIESVAVHKRMQDILTLEKSSDEDKRVLAARYGSKDVLDRLANDPESRVRGVVKRRLRGEH